MLAFKIKSSRTVEDEEKKYVAYMLQVERNADSDPVCVERRYTHFLDLFNGLKKDHPSIMSSHAIDFPKKMLVGNFDAANITSRGLAFESFLSLLNETELRESPAAISFFQDIELNLARKLLGNQDYEFALFSFITSFKLLNKVYTERSPVVIGALCRIIACAENADDFAGHVEPFTHLALKRYQTISDYDLLMLYVPLLNACINIWKKLGTDTTALTNELEKLKKQGMNVDSVLKLMEAVDKLSIYSK